MFKIQKLLPVILVFLVVMVVIATSGWVGIEATYQPIKFNHLKHKEQGLQCLDCHKYAKEYRFAGLPDAEVCSKCHQTKLTESREEEKLFQFIQDKSPIPWNRIYHVPDHVYYSHAEHVGLANLECQSCHGNIGEKKTPYLSGFPPFEIKQRMCVKCGDCMDACPYGAIEVLVRKAKAGV